jgi:phosphatidylglycerol:prolipoprotein diacylglycerol transferase
MLYFGLLFGVAGGNYAANLAGMNSARVFVATLVLLIPALAGARLLFVALHWKMYRQAPRRMWRRSEGGAALFGGLLLALLTSMPLLRLMQVPFGSFWDVASFTMLIGTIFGRMGCLLNGCCAGRPTNSRLALNLPDYQGVWRRRIPTPLVEAGWVTLLLAGAAAFWPRLPFPGALVLYVLGGYGMGRFVLECTYEEHTHVVGKMTVHQVISVLLIIVSLTIVSVAWPR